jgi:hypothetical protein
VTSSRSSDRWVPLPASGSGPPVLRRHCIPAPPTPLAAPRDYWTAAPLKRSAAPLLEKHWAPITTIPPQVRPPAHPPHSTQAVTAASKSVTPPPEAPKPPGAMVARPAEIVTPRLPVSSSQTVTRLCVGCGKPLEGKRPQAKAHAAACRQRAYRRRKKGAGQAPSQGENGREPEPEVGGLTHRLAS